MGLWVKFWGEGLRGLGSRQWEGLRLAVGRKGGPVHLAAAPADPLALARLTGVLSTRPKVGPAQSLGWTAQDPAGSEFLGDWEEGSLQDRGLCSCWGWGLQDVPGIGPAEGPAALGLLRLLQSGIGRLLGASWSRAGPSRPAPPCPQVTVGSSVQRAQPKPFLSSGTFPAPLPAGHCPPPWP